MGIPLQSVLQVRYMDSSTVVGTKSYGGGDTNNEECIELSLQESPIQIESIDASRSHITYFDINSYLGGDLNGMSGIVETSNINKQAVNRAVNFLNTAYVLIGDRIYEYVQESGTWITSTTLTSKTGTETNSIGLYPVFINNIPTLITAWNTTSNNWRYAKLNGDTKSWTISADLTGPFDPSDSNGGILNEHQHGTKIYFVSSNTTVIGWYDFENDGFGTVTWNDTVRHPMDFCTFGGDLYCLNKDASSNVKIHRIEKNFTVIEATFNRTSQTPPLPDRGSALTTTNNFEGRPLLFVDNVYDSGNPTMYAEYIVNGIDLIGGPANDSNHGLEIGATYGHNTDGSLTSKAIVGSPAGSFMANPFKMMTNQASTGDDSDVRKGEGIVLRCFVDQKNRDVDLSDLTNISASVRFSVDCEVGNGGGGDFGNLHYFKFGGSGTAPLYLEIIRPDGQASSFEWTGSPIRQVRHRALVHEKIGGGARYYELNNSNEQLPNIIFKGLSTTNQNGVVRINYGLQTSNSAPSGTNVTVRWFYDDKQHAPESLCTLVGTSDGIVSGLYLATDIPIEDKDYFVDWNALGDGATKDVRININGQVQTALTASTSISSPTDLGGLTLWLEANDTTTITSGTNIDVSSWNDKSGAGLVSGVIQSVVALRPDYIFNSNNGNGGVQFTSASGHYLFASGAPITTGPMTTIVIYEPISSSARQTIASFANDKSFSAMSGTDYFSIFTSGDLNSIATESQDIAHIISMDSPRELGIASGGRVPGLTKIAVWRDIDFNTALQYSPSGPEVEIWEVGNSVKPTGISNTSIGRFSGAIESGVYVSAGDYYDGIIYEVVTYNRQLFDIEVERFIKYAEVKYTLLL